MKKFWKKTSLFLVTAAMTVSAPLMAWALEHDIVILHTNDIHCGINDNIGFAGLAQIKKDALARTPNVALVDAGDAIQGAPIGKLSRGLAVVSIMNYLGYDFCIPGNHEFDYGMDRFLELVPLQRAGYYCANFVYAGNNKQVLPGYKIMQYEDTKVAFVGASTPESLTTSTPTFFQNEKGKYISSARIRAAASCTSSCRRMLIRRARKAQTTYLSLAIWVWMALPRSGAAKALRKILRA